MPTSTPAINIQGNPVTGNQINPEEFFRYTRRLRGAMAGNIPNYAGLGNPDVMELKPTGILGAIDIKFEGSLVVTPSTGSVATTARWPYSLVKYLKLSANGQTNLINCNGTFLKARELIANPSLNDRGVEQTIAGATEDQGTLSLNEEQWGVGQATTSLAAGTYPVELSWRVPVAWDLVKLYGALYLQTAATAVSLEIDWAPPSDLFTIVSPATVALTGGWMAEGVVFNIPSVNGSGVIPDLSTFHAIAQSNTTAIGTTTNQVVLSGQGVNKQLMRIIGQVWSGSTAPGAPLPMNKANFGNLGWGYGLSETPEIWQDGDSMAIDVERAYSSDLGKYQGMFVIDFARHWSFRDSVNEAAASQLQLILGVAATLTNPRLEYAQEVMINAASAA